MTHSIVTATVVVGSREEEAVKVGKLHVVVVVVLIVDSSKEKKFAKR